MINIAYIYIHIRTHTYIKIYTSIDIYIYIYIYIISHGNLAGRLFQDLLELRAAGWVALLLFMVESRDDLYGVHKEPTSLLGSCSRQSLLKIYHAMQPLRPASKHVQRQSGAACRAYRLC